MKLAYIAAVAATLTLAACRSNKPDVIVRREPQQPSTVVVEKDHSGHYYYNGHWYAEPAHITIVD